MVEPGGEYCAGVLEQMRQRGGSKPWIELDRHVVVDDDVNLMGPQHVLHLLARGGDDLRRMGPSRVLGDGARVDAGHIEDVLEQPRQSRRLGQDQVALLQTLGVGQLGPLEVARRDADGRQRRPQVVAERRQQRRLQLLALAGRARRLSAAPGSARAPPRSRQRRRAYRAYRLPPAARLPPGRQSAWSRPGAGRGGYRGRSPRWSGGRRRFERRHRTRERSEPPHTRWTAGAWSSATGSPPA